MIYTIVNSKLIMSRIEYLDTPLPLWLFSSCENILVLVNIPYVLTHPDENDTITTHVNITR